MVIDQSEDKISGPPRPTKSELSGRELLNPLVGSKERRQEAQEWDQNQLGEDHGAPQSSSHPLEVEEIETKNGRHDQCGLVESEREHEREHRHWDPQLQEPPKTGTDETQWKTLNEQQCYEGSLEGRGYHDASSYLHESEEAMKQGASSKPKEPKT